MAIVRHSLAVVASPPKFKGMLPKGNSIMAANFQWYCLRAGHPRKPSLGWFGIKPIDADLY